MRPHRLASRLRGVLLAALALVLATGGCTRRNGGPASGPADWALAPEEAHYGASYAEWSARWWQWAYEQPRTNHPLFDETGADAWRGQVDPVWFLGGPMAPNLTDPTLASCDRTFTLPSGIALFFPIICVSWDNQECAEPDTTYSLTELRAFAYEAVQNAIDLHCELDGVPLVDSPDLAGAVRYRAMAPEFSTSLPADNIFTQLCGEPAVPVVYDPVTSDGVWMMIGPMPPGGHLLHFSGTFPNVPSPYHIDATFHITVLP